jgi:hypothetical protein
MAVANSLRIADHAAADDNENEHNYAHIKHFNDTGRHIHNFVYYRKIHNCFDNYDVHENTEYCNDDFLDNNETHVNFLYFDDGYFNDDKAHNDHHKFNNDTDDNAHSDHHYFNSDTDDNNHNDHHFLYNDNDNSAHNDNHDYKYDYFDGNHDVNNDLSYLEDNIDMDGTGRSGPLREEPLGRVCI